MISLAAGFYFTADPSTCMLDDESTVSVCFGALRMLFGFFDADVSCYPPAIGGFKAVPASVVLYG